MVLYFINLYSVNGASGRYHGAGPAVSLLGNSAIHTAGRVNSNSLIAMDTTVITTHRIRLKVIKAVFEHFTI